jgi:formylglycine-generating enzyme
MCKRICFAVLILCTGIISCAGIDRRGQDLPEKNIGGMVMVQIPAGSFMMGASDDDPDAEVGEKPRHKVVLDSFMIGKFEVSQEKYGQLVSYDPSYNKSNIKNPAEQVSWYDAIEFCNELSKKAGLKQYYKIDKTKIDPENLSQLDNLQWLVSFDELSDGFRLPTEAQWEYASRAGTDTLFFRGNTIDADYVWYMGKLTEWTIPVESKKPNNFGLHNVTGNV